MWLVKVPQFVAEAWQGAGEGAELGTVRLGAGASPEAAGGAAELHLPPGAFPRLPDGYKLVPSMGQGVCTVAVGGRGVEGRVAQSFATQPLPGARPGGIRGAGRGIDSRYSAISRERMERERAAAQQKTAKVLSGADARKLHGAKEDILPANYVGKGKRPDIGQKVSDNRRTREKDRGKITDLILSLFERQHEWTFDGLLQETQQPAAYLRELLQELCDYKKTTLHQQGTWTVREKYRA